MTAYKEIRRLSAGELRALCVRQSWYTKGDNDQYDHLLLDLAGHKGNLSTMDIIAIAEDIAAHSELSEGESMTDIAFAVNRACSVRFVPTMPDFRYLDGPWNNFACKGYAIMAMTREGLDDKLIQSVMNHMTYCFDDTTVEEAAGYYCKETAIR